MWGLQSAALFANPDCGLLSHICMHLAWQLTTASTVLAPSLVCDGLAEQPRCQIVQDVLHPVLQSKDDITP